MARFLHAAGVDELERYEITLTVCEAAGNAIEHAYGPGDAELRRGGPRWWATSSRRASATAAAGASAADEHRGRGLKIIEGMMDDVDITSEPGGYPDHDAAAARTSRAA